MLRAPGVVHMAVLAAGASFGEGSPLLEQAPGDRPGAPGIHKQP